MERALGALLIGFIAGGVAAIVFEKMKPKI
jgi:hypothetical protein